MISWRLIRAIDVATAAALLFGLALSVESQAQEQEKAAPMAAPPATTPRALRSRGGEQSSANQQVIRAGAAPVAGAEAGVSPDPAEAYFEPPGNVVPPGTEFDEVEDTDPSALTDFNESLEPHGTWVEDSKFGRIWVPDARVVGTQFAPYVTRGRWALTADNQWLWESDYPFGSVTFHYGRWVWAAAHGWAWIPGRRYSPAWVNFRVGHSTHLGWAPMAPRYIWRRGAVSWLGAVPPSAYVFIPFDYAFYPSLQSYVVFQHSRVRPLMIGSRAYFPRGINRRYRHRYYSPSLRHVPARARARARVRARPSGLRFQRFRRGDSPRISAKPRARRPSSRPSGRARRGAATAGMPSRSLNSARTRARPASAKRPSKRLKSRATTRVRPKTDRKRSRPESDRKRSRAKTNRAKKPKRRRAATQPQAKTKTSRKAKGRSFSGASNKKRSSTRRSSSGRLRARPRKSR